MSVLDELRDQMEQFDVADAGFSPQAVQVAMVVLLDTFVEAHPGLMDTTVRCRECGKPTVEAGASQEGRMGLWIWDICCSEECAIKRGGHGKNACAKEATE